MNIANRVVRIVMLDLIKKDYSENISVFFKDQLFDDASLSFKKILRFICK